MQLTVSRQRLIRDWQDAEAARRRRVVQREGVSPLLTMTPLLLLGACASVGREGIASVPRVTLSGNPDTLSATAGGAAVQRLDGGAASLLANDVATNTSAAITVTAVTVGSGTSAVPGTVGSQLHGSLGTLTIAADGSFSFAVADNDAVRALAAGETAINRFTYTPTVAGVSDAPITVTVTVTGINDAPVAVADTNNVVAGTPTTVVTGNVRANDSDPDNGTLRGQLTVTSVAKVVGGVAGSGQPVAAPLTGDYGTLTLNADGSYSYALNTAGAVRGLAAGTTATDVFSYTIADPQGATATTTLTVTVTGAANSAPVALPDSASVIAQTAAPITGNVRTNDNDVESPRSQLSVISIATVSGGVAGVAQTIDTPITGTYGALTINADGTYSYALANSSVAVIGLTAGQVVTDRFAYTIADPQGASATTTLTISVSGSGNNAPIAVADSDFVVAQQAANTTTGNVRNNDTDPDASTVRTQLAVTGAAKVTGGVAGTVVAAGSAIAGDYGTVTINADGSYVYVLDNTRPAVVALLAGQTLPDTFSYTIADPQGLTATTTLTINVAGPGGTNVAPVALPDQSSIVATAIPNFVSGNVRANDSDVNSQRAQLSVTNVSANGGVAQATGAPISGKYGVLGLNSDGSYVYTLDNTNTAIIALAPGQTADDVFTYTLVDPQGLSATTTLTLHVNGIDDAPVTADDAQTVIEDVVARTTVTGNLLANDTDPEGAALHIDHLNNSGGNRLTLGTVINTRLGPLTVNDDGTYSFSLDNSLAAVNQLAQGGSTTALFYYFAADATGHLTRGTLRLTALGTNDAPVARDDFATVQEDVKLVATGSVLTNDRDFDLGSSVTVDQAAVHGGTLAALGTDLVGQYGTLHLNGDGTYTFTLNNSLAAVQALGSTQSLTDVFDYRVTDGLGGRTTASLTVTIGGSDEPGLSQTYTAPVTGNITLAATNDVLTLANGATVSGSVDGGAGIDTLPLRDWAGTISLSQIVHGGISHFETIILSGSSVSTTLNLTGADAAALLPVDSILRFTGGPEDAIHLDASFLQGADQTVGATLYHVFTSGAVTAYVDAALPVI